MAQVRNYRDATPMEELEWRGLINQSTDREQLAAVLNGNPISYYCGFDPTAPSLHIGNLVQLIVMRHLQADGHQPYALVGGATGLIGDPRQSGERTLNPKEIVAGWVERLRTQISRFLDAEGDNAVRFVNNYDWTANMSVIDFLRDVGKNFRMGTMLSKETTDSQGKKFGKSEGNAMWLDPTMLSPYKFYQFWFNQPDDQVVKLLKVFTFLPKDEIERLAGEVEANPGAREAQKTLAWEVTSYVHGEEATRQAIDAAAALFGRGGDLRTIGEDTLEAAIEGLKVDDGEGGRTFAQVAAGDRVAEAGVKAGLFKSVSEARKTIKSGGVYINNQRVEDQDQLLAEDDFLEGGYALIRRGKKALGAVRRVQ